MNPMEQLAASRSAAEAASRAAKYIEALGLDTTGMADALAGLFTAAPEPVDQNEEPPAEIAVETPGALEGTPADASEGGNP